MNLIEVAHLKALCSKIGIDYVTGKGDELHMRFSMSADIDLLRVLPAIKDFPQYLSVRGTNPPVITYYERHREPEALLKGCVKLMEQVVERYEKSGMSDGDEGS